MVDPGLALLVFGVLAVFLVAVVWPRRGLAARIALLWRRSEQVRVEDTLKHLYNGEYLGERRSLGSVADRLGLSPNSALRLVARIEALGLLRSGAGGLALTDEGRAEALRILRRHRLWERYLADRTSVPAPDWHDDAERREHTLSPADAERLSARMGHPRFDPHGDPIPTADGEVPPARGVALVALEPGATASIVHLEDEPREVYQRLIAEGLAPGMSLSVLSATPERIRFLAGGREHVLEPVVALNITVTPSATRKPPERMETLDSLSPGESARVVAISPTCQGPQRRRLLDLGIVPGTIIRADMTSALADPVAYRIRGALIALRRQQASLISITRSLPGAGP